MPLAVVVKDQVLSVTVLIMSGYLLTLRALADGEKLERQAGFKFVHMLVLRCLGRRCNNINTKNQVLSDPPLKIRAFEDMTSSLIFLWIQPVFPQESD